MKMERDILDIIVDKEFVNLTVIEKQELEQFCTTKAEFDNVYNDQLVSIFRSTTGLETKLF